MSFCERDSFRRHDCNFDHDCDCCDPCELKKYLSILWRKFKDLKPSYGAFWQTDSITVPATGNDVFTFNNQGPRTNDIIPIGNNTLRVVHPGVYHIFYRVGISTPAGTTTLISYLLNLYVNGSPVPNSQAAFGISIAQVPVIPTCFAVSGDAIIRIPANANLQLRNDGTTSITTCTAGNNTVYFNIVKIG